VAARDPGEPRPAAGSEAPPERLDRPGAAVGPDADASGGPHASRPVGEQPTWAREDPHAGRRGFGRAFVIVFGMFGLLIVAILILTFALSGREPVSSPLSRPGAAQPDATTQGQSGATRAEPVNPPQNLGTGQSQGGGGRQLDPARSGNK
jgi:hypothetical protein